MHLDEGTIHAWLDGALDAEEAARVERHAAECGTCAAAVAEARGLVAGASRILTALDGVPGGVVPKSTASAATARSRRTRSLWTTLHLTPARAAAAAVIVMAAGTALVLHNAPDESRSAIKLTDYPTSSAAPLKAAPPLAVPHVAAAPDTTASQTISAPARARTSRRAAVGQGGEGRAASVAAAPSAKPVNAGEVAASDAMRRDRITDSLATKRELAEARSAVADNAVRGAMATGAASPAPAAPSPVAQRYAEARKSAEVRSAAGCYPVTTESAIALPSRLWLDSSAVPQPAAMLRAKAAAANASAPERHGVSEIANDARRAISGAFWTPRPDGSIRLSLPASSVNVDLFPAPGSTLVGAMPLGGRSVTVTLRRVDCGSR